MRDGRGHRISGRPFNVVASSMASDALARVRRVMRRRSLVVMLTYFGVGACVVGVHWLTAEWLLLALLRHDVGADGLVPFDRVVLAKLTVWRFAPLAVLFALAIPFGAWMGRAWRRAFAAEGVCGACGRGIGGLPRGEDGCVVCSACGAAWGVSIKQT